MLLWELYYFTVPKRQTKAVISKNFMDSNLLASKASWKNISRNRCVEVNVLAAFQHPEICLFPWQFQPQLKV